MSLIHKCRAQLIDIGRETAYTSWELIKITVPVIIFTKILAELGFIVVISKVMEPLMGLVGLPGELGFVWATGMLTTLYGAIAAFAALAPALELSGAQVTILGAMLLIAHSLPVELIITKKAGAGLVPMAAIRLGGALVYGMLLYHLAELLQVWQEPAVIFFQAGDGGQGLAQWIEAQIINIGIIVVVIFCILVIMRLLRGLGVLALLEKLLSPVLPFFGMSHRAAPITVVGMIMGLAYGGALIIRETTTGVMEKREIFNSLALMSLCHGLVEDTLLMMAIGSKLAGILWGRLLFSLLLLYIIVRVSDYMRARTSPN
jgi:hypothetical protein